MTRTKAEEECMILACTQLSTRAYESNVHTAVTKHAEQLYDRQQEWCDSLLAAWAEASLPSGFLPSGKPLSASAPIKTVQAASLVLSSLADRVIQDGIRSAGTARLLAVAVYRSSATWHKYSDASPIVSLEPDTTAACVAYLEIARVSLTANASRPTLVAMVDPAIQALLRHESTDVQARARQILQVLVKVDANLAPVVLAKLQALIGQEAITDPRRLSAENLALLSKVNAEIRTVESFSALETFINTSLLWVVRRFAEDETNDQSTSELVEGLCKSSITSEILVKYC